jgi:hypothetical protein
MEEFIVNELTNLGFELPEELKEAIEHASKTVYMAGVLDGQYDSKKRQEAIEYFEAEDPQTFLNA